MTATGAASRTGKTISLVKHASPNGHLQQLLGKIIGYLAILDSVLAVILIIAAVIRGENLIALLPFLAMLFIATIPIAMPSSFAVANAVEAKVLSQHHVLVSDLTGIQEAANLNLLLVDKTGTITANKPSVVAFQNTSTLTDDEVLALAVGATDERHPSVVDTAIQNAAAKTASPASQVTKYVPFTPGLGYSQATVTVDGQAPKTVRLGAYRVLSAQAENTPIISREILSRGRSVAVLADNQLLGVYILQDQPRSTSRQAIADLQQRGIQVIMLTGDHQPTAATIAGEVGLSGQVLSFSDITDTTDIGQLAGIADVVPENKLAITKQLQSAGYIVGMTGDGVNDAPALKQADVGIAVENAVDLAKQSARMVLMTPGLTPIVDILDSGHRVYQRMMTWAITKLSRTAELTLFLTLGYLWLGNIPLSLNAMVLVAILNDLVTLVLGTDNTVISHQPEQWNLKKLSRIAILLASGWTIVGFGLLAWLHVTGVTPGRISTLLFIYLIFSAMVTILMTRTTRHFWKSRPSNAVVTAIGGNCVLTLVLSWIGLGIAQVTVTSTIIVIGLVLLTGIGLSFLPLGNLANQD
ncbi:E1-E2 family cation-transport ATPase [Secundilactobacillus paracollinoides DSM 15502 = JCM 11969]|nr:E1-E2 family cation-transport ATPase [Secundilactobacillus paracollinoides DSM 15502 = JCM 11969]